MGMHLKSSSATTKAYAKVLQAVTINNLEVDGLLRKFLE
jgi:hypothetical protein